MIILQNIRKVYSPNKANAFEALKGISLEIKDGALTAVTGRSGAGKSTLLHILACIDRAESGSYQLSGTDVTRLSERKRARIRNEKIGMVMQDFALINDFTALENVLLPLEFARQKRPGKRALAMQALESVGMADFAKKPVSQLSGGQKQRVAIARAIVNQPALILADEPTGALDSKTAQEIMELFKSLNAQGKTVVIVTHDAQIAAQCGQIITISDGQAGSARIHFPPGT